jgi:hypothetical protein
MKNSDRLILLLCGFVVFSVKSFAYPYVPPVRTMEIPAREVDIHFDGVDDEASWSSAQSMSIFNPTGWDGSDEDFSGYFKVCWDMHYLYFYANITDDINESFYEEYLNPWEFDEIEIYVNLDTVDGYNTQYDDNTMQLLISRGIDTVNWTGRVSASEYYYYWHEKETGDGWVVETGIPWTAIMPVGSEQDDIMDYITNKIGFDVAFGDSDNADGDPTVGSRDIQSAWDEDDPSDPSDRTEDNAWNNVLVFGIIDLIGTPAPPPPPPPPPYKNPYYRPINHIDIPSSVAPAVIDGVNEEPSYVNTFIPTLFYGTGTTGMYDLSGLCQAYWDSAYLYLYSYIRDDVAHDWTGTGDPMEFDNFELLLDLDTNQMSGVYDENAVRLLFCRGVDTVCNTGRALQSDFRYYSESTTSGWKFEAAIPWTCTLPEGSMQEDVIPFLSNSIGFDFIIIDSDGSDPDAGEIDAKATWDLDNGRERFAWDSTYALGVIRLVPGDSVVSISSYNSTDIKIYPNPASQTVNILADSELSQITIITMNGQVLKKIDASGPGMQIDVADLKRGIYILQGIMRDGSIRIALLSIQ